FIAEIGIEDRGAVDHRARRYRLQRDAADADADTCKPGKLPLQDQQFPRGQQHRIADVEIIVAADAELAGRLAADQEGDQIAPSSGAASTSSSPVISRPL